MKFQVNNFNLDSVPLICRSDSYKYSHYGMFPPGTENNNSYIEARGIADDSMLPPNSEIVVFGPQACIKENLLTRLTREEVDFTEFLLKAHGVPFNREGYDIIIDEYDGFFPLEISALPEGSIVNPSVAIVQVRATDPRFAWLASWVETLLIRGTWYPTTVATISREAKKIIKSYLDKTSDDTAGQLPFKLHDFGARGVSSGESAVLGGVAHLVNFMGTDTVEGLVGAMMYYNAETAVGYSVPASEHSTMTAWGRDHEADAFDHIISTYGGKYPIVSIVSDSYDIYNATNKIIPSLKDKILNSGSMIVVRPDSGDPINTPLAVVRILAEHFGTVTNNKGYKVLNNVRVLQGDGINLESIRQILQALQADGFSADNIVFGMGGALLQKLDRDTLKFAQKTNAIYRNGEWHDVYKQPIGSSFKKSKAGILATYKTDAGVYRTVRKDQLDEGQRDALEVVYRNGELLRDMTFDEVRKNAEL